MAFKSCFPRSTAEQLYMLELLVDRLNLTLEKIQEIGSKPLTVKIKFLDFPEFEIKEEEFWSSKKRNEKQKTLLSERKRKDGSLDFGAGKSCLFPNKPEELVDAMRSKPLKIGIYKTIVEEACPSEDKDPPICKTEVPLTGCLCDQVSMSMNDKENLPKPYTLRNTWNLIDDEEKPSGTILLFLRLTCLGKSIITQFVVKNESFLFKTSDSSNEFQCSRVPEEDQEEERKKKFNEKVDCLRKDYSEPEVSSLKPRSVIGLASICQELAKRDGGPSEFVPPSKPSCHRLLEKKPSRKCDIPPEKRIIHGDCGCQSFDTFSTKNYEQFPCGRRHYSGGLCIGPKTDDSFITNIGTISTMNSWNYSYEPRMRGGGLCTGGTSATVNIYGKDNDDRPRYRERSRFPASSVENFVSGSCKATIPGNKAGYRCFGKLGTEPMGKKDLTRRTDDFGSSNEPYQGIDCLIKALRETEDFVDSIGKVPGLAGLGLMDPSESPFFHREKDDVRICTPEQKIASPKAPPKSLPTHHRSREHSPEKTDAKIDAPTLHPQGEVASSITTKGKRKSDEKSDKQREIHEPIVHGSSEIESAPCGQTKCKSKKKKMPEKEQSLANDVDESEQKITRKTSGFRKSRQRRQKSSTLPGPDGDRKDSRRNSNVRVSKKIMKLVHTYGTPKSCYGHKNCLDVRLKVPGNMGWLWNTYESPCCLKTPLGWKPGAISKFVWERLQQAKKIKSIETTNSTGEIRTSSQGSRGKKIRNTKSKSFHAFGRSHWTKNRIREPDDDEIELPPTLHIHRKDGTYYVTMYPVKAKGTNEEPEVDPKPLQFKITKDKENEDADSSSTGSDMEIEFSPPAAIDRYKKKEPVKDQDTQVTLQEILEAMKDTNPKPPSSTKKVKHKK